LHHLSSFVFDYRRRKASEDDRTAVPAISSPPPSLPSTFDIPVEERCEENTSTSFTSADATHQSRYFTKE